MVNDSLRTHIRAGTIIGTQPGWSRSDPTFQWELRDDRGAVVGTCTDEYLAGASAMNLLDAFGYRLSLELLQAIAAVREAPKL